MISFKKLHNPNLPHTGCALNSPKRIFSVNWSMHIAHNIKIKKQSRQKT